MMEALRSLRFRIAAAVVLMAALAAVALVAMARDATWHQAMSHAVSEAQADAQSRIGRPKAGDALLDPNAYLLTGPGAPPSIAIISDTTSRTSAPMKQAISGDWRPCSVDLRPHTFTATCGNSETSMLGIGHLQLDETHDLTLLDRVETTYVTDTMRRFDAGIPFVALGVLGSGFLAWFAAGAVQRPVARASLATRAIAGGNLKLRLPTGRDAFGRLSRDVNTMVDELERKITDLEASERRQRELLADVAHELRTPMTALLASADALEDPSTRDEAAAVVAPQLRRLAVLTEDVLEMSQLDSGTSELRLDRVSLAALAHDAAAGRARVSSTGDATAAVDPRRVHAIVRNLIDNAARHGAAPITCDVTGTADDVVVTVSDAGPGIPPSQRERIFDRFVRGDSARSGGGSGLGLAIARENARLHGGDLTLRDDGRTFELRLPRDADVQEICTDSGLTAAKCS